MFVNIKNRKIKNDKKGGFWTINYEHIDYVQFRNNMYPNYQLTDHCRPYIHGYPTDSLYRKPLEISKRNQNIPSIFGPRGVCRNQEHIGKIQYPYLDNGIMNYNNDLLKYKIN